MFSDSIKQRAIKELSNGATLAQVAKRFKTSSASVAKWRNQATSQVKQTQPEATTAVKTRNKTGMKPDDTIADLRRQVRELSQENADLHVLVVDTLRGRLN